MKTMKIMLAVVAFTFLAAGSYAQTPKADVSVGYAFDHFNGSNGSDGFHLNGFDASVGFNWNRFFGFVGDFGVQHGSPSGVSTTNTTYTFGPRISARVNDKFVPFAQALFGGAHQSASVAGVKVTSNPFAFSFGGGVDLGIIPGNRVALRPQVDYFGFHSNGNTVNSERVSVSLVFNL